jgi:pimeloyl-ACP methyl ester carboxylesterase
VPVIALHCSGAGASEWYSLAEALGDDYELLAPEHYGSASNGAWAGEHAFTLSDDAARAIALMDASQSKIHLVGHSYGGGVALHVALARPSQIASMVLYEPSAFHLLQQLGAAGAARRSRRSLVLRGMSQMECSPVIIAELLQGSSIIGVATVHGRECVQRRNAL